FGDGATSAERYPLHTYAAPGTYDVRLTVTDDQHLSQTATLAYTVLQPPTADFTWSPPTPDEGQSTTFSDTSPNPDGAIVDRTWLFPHLKFAPTGSTAFTSFPDSGDIPVALVVTDRQLLQMTVTKTVTVRNV